MPDTEREREMVNNLAGRIKQRYVKYEHLSKEKMILQDLVSIRNIHRLIANKINTAFDLTI